MNTVEANLKSAQLLKQLQATKEKAHSKSVETAESVQRKQREVEELKAECVARNTSDRMMPLGKAEKIAASVLNRQPKLFRKLAQ